MTAAQLVNRPPSRRLTVRSIVPVCLAVALGVEATTFAVLLHRVDVAHHSLLLVTIATPAFGVAVALLAQLRMSARAAALLVTGTGVAFQLIALSQRPLTSDDDYRYIWDGRVQLAGIDPYRYAPSAPQLARLRDTLLFGTPGHCGHLIAGGCTAINRPTVHTVYPPVAQALFVVVRVLSLGGHGGRLPFQVAGALGATAVTVVLARRALNAGRPVWPVALWAWCPVTISEFGNNAHLDWLAVLLTVLAVQAAAARRTGAAGLLLGAAVLTKLYPLVVLPSMLRRRPRVLLAAGTALVVLSYLPHVVAVGTKVIGFLPGYLHQEGYSSGSHLLLLDAVLPNSAAVVVAGALAVAVAWWAYRHADADRPERTAVVVSGWAFLIATPNYGWYAGLLIALVVMSERWEWMPVAMAPTFTYLYRGEWLHTGIPSAAIYLVAGVLAVVLALLRTGRISPATRSWYRSSSGSVLAGQDPPEQSLPAPGGLVRFWLVRGKRERAERTEQAAALLRRHLFDDAGDFRAPPRGHLADDAPPGRGEVE